MDDEQLGVDADVAAAAAAAAAAPSRRRQYGDQRNVDDAECQMLVNSTTSTTTSNDADSDFEQNVSRLCQYLSESGDEDEEEATATDEASSSSQATLPPHGMKEHEQQQLRPSTGPYYQRTARPILPADFLNIPPPSHPPDASPTLEHRPLPPQWQPPIPPTPPSSASCIDESQYDEAQPPEPALRPSKQSVVLPGSFHKTPTLPRTVNGYEVSASQRQRDSGSAMGVDWDECRGSLLRENPETGSFYVPSGSGHTTMSSLSPQSRRLDNDKCSYSLLPGARTTVPVNVLPVRPEYTGGPSSMSGNATKSVMSPLAVKKPSKQKKLKSTWTHCSWRCLTYALAIALIFCLAVICFLLVSLLSAGSLNGAGGSYAGGTSVFGDGMAAVSTVRPLRPLPESFELGEEVVADLPPGMFAYTYFTVQRGARVSFNLSVEPQAKLVVYGRQTVVPSPTAHDFVEIVRGDRLHLAGGDRRKRRINYALATSNMRSTIFLHYLLAGRWHLGFLNDAVVPQTIRLIAALSDDDRVDDCKYDCYGKGICKDGKCFCHRGFSGPHCEETSCPVLCSGNGLFAGGRCHCHQGWKGADCDVPAHVCEVPNCSGHGTCANDGRCVCDRGFTGEFCERRSCPSEDCSGHGVCVDGKCYCEFGWKNENCDDAYTSQSMCSPGGMVGSHFDAACSNHGVFDHETSSCLCDRDFTGDRCQTEICPATCIHGVCKEAICVCDAGWMGEQCDTVSCLPGCEEHGSCHNGTCKCIDGWNGENCQLEGCPNNCNGVGDCRKFANKWICMCDAQHYGTDCSIPRERECDDGQDNDGDGLTDCEDSECCSTKACVKSQLCQTVVHPATVLMRGNTPSVTANFFQKIKFLIQADSVQQYADERLFNESRASVIRGRVLSENGAPLIGVRVAETAHPPLYGFTITRGGDGGGVFDLLVNGGRSVTLQFMRKPYDKIERQFAVPWNAIVYVGDIILSRDQAESAPKTQSAACQAMRRQHRLRPTLLTSWLVTRFPGAVGGNGGQLLADSRVIFDSIAIPGTSELFLTYDSARAAGFKSTITLQLVPSKMPQQLRRISLIIDIAGDHFDRMLEAKPNLTFTYGWNKRNVYSQAVYGLTDAKVSVGYVYAGCDEPIWEYDRVKLDGHKSSGSKLGGWNLNIHHHFDIANNVLERGDGSVMYVSETARTLVTTLGSTTQRPLSCPFCNGPASSATLFQPTALAADGNGSLFVGDYNLIRRVSSHGTVTTVLELSPADTAHAYFLAVDPTSGELYISLPLRRQVWKISATEDAPVDPTANFQVIVGDGNTCVDSACGDGGPADLASLSFPKGIAFDARGTLFVADGRRVRMVTADRLIRSLVSDKAWTPRSCVADMSLSELNLEWPTALAVDLLRQTLLVLDSDVVYRIDVAAELARIEVGAPSGCDSLTASTNDTLSVVRLHSARALAVDNEGALLVVESNAKRLNQVRAFGRDGRPTLLAGKSSKCDCDRRNCPCDNDGQVLARDAHLHQPVAIVVDAAGSIHIADQANFKIKSMNPMRPAWDVQQRLHTIVSADTNEIYLFNGFGQHVATQSLLSGQFVYNFTYHIDNSYGRLLQVIGGGGHRLYFVRRSDTEIQIETSHAVKTTLRLGNFDHMLETVALPDGGVIRLDHDAGKGLLLSKVDSDGRAWFYDYDSDGRADRLVTPAGDTYRVSQSVVDHQLVSCVTKNGKRFNQFVVSPSELAAVGASNRRVLVVDGGFYVDANGYRLQFDGSDHPLLGPHETTLLKRKASLPALVEPQRRELTSRLEWRSFLRREGKGAAKRVAQVGRRPRVNGRNAFTVEFDRKERMDNLTDHADHKLLVVHYNEAGQIVGYEPSVADLAPMNISYDSHGRTKRLAWGERRAAFVYDHQSRLTDATAGPDGNLLPRKYTYAQESSDWPSTVQVPSGLDYSIVYDSRGGLSEITTPSGDDHYFSVVHDFGRSVLIRSVPFAGEPFVFALDDQQRPSEFVSPMGLRRVSYQRDDLDRLSAVVADGVAVVFRYSDGGDRPVVVESPHFRRETIRQGPLPVSVSERRTVGEGESATTAHFAYEYDDLLRLSAVHASFDGSATLEPARFTYDSNSGRLSRVKSYNLLYDGAKTRLMGDNNVVLERIYGAHRELVHLRLVIHGNKAMEQTAHYDSAGRVEGVERTVVGEQRSPQVRTYNVDGTLGQLNIGDQPHRWTLHYDLDGRLKAVNDNKLQLVDGLPVDMEQLKFETDASGAVIRRGDEWFEYDAFGRLRRISQKDATDVTYAYDDSDRLIGRKSGRNGPWTHFFYALPDRPNLLTHATAGETITAFYYDDEDRLFAMQRAGTHYLIIVDVDGSPSFIFDGNGAVVKEVLRDPLGRIVTDTNPEFDLPIGWRGHLQDAQTGVVFIDGRPMDTSTMRYMSVSPNALLAPIDPLYPETVDLFRVDPIGQMNLPTDPVSWLRLVGIDMRNVAPLLQLNDRRWLSTDWDAASALCPRDRSVLSAAECGVAGRIQHFSRFTTVSPSLVLPPGLGFGTVRRSRWTNVASVVGAGVSISTDRANRAVVHMTEAVDMSTHDALNMLLNESFFVTARLGLSDAIPESRAVVERHFWKKSAEQSVQDLTALGIVSETATLTPLLNITVGDSQVTIIGPRSRTIIHYGPNIETLKRRLLEEQTGDGVRKLWAREADLVRRKWPTRTQWSETQQQQLLTDGVVSGFAPIFRPPPADSGVAASLTDLTFWAFEPTESAKR